MEISPVSGAPGDAPPGGGEIVLRIFLWACGAVLLALILIVGYLAYLNPAMLIEFASLRLCG